MSDDREQLQAETEEAGELEQKEPEIPEVAASLQAMAATERPEEDSEAEDGADDLEEEEVSEEETEDDPPEEGDAKEQLAIDDHENVLEEAIDLERGEKLKEIIEEEEEQGAKLPWSAKIESAKEYFQTELLYRYDLLEVDQREAVAGRYRIELKGNKGGIWTFTAGDQINVVNTREEADVVTSMQQRDFLSLVNGVLNPQLAILAKKIKIQGDLGTAMRFLELFAPSAEDKRTRVNR